jgi:hypothetical protein
MHTTMIGAWNGVEEVQQGWDKSNSSSSQFGIQEQCAIKRMPRSHTELGLDVLYIWLEAQFHIASNGTGIMPKFVIS